MSDQAVAPDRSTAIEAVGWGSPADLWQPHNPAGMMVVGCTGCAWGSIIVELFA